MKKILNLFKKSWSRIRAVGGEVFGGQGGLAYAGGITSGAGLVDKISAGVIFGDFTFVSPLLIGVWVVGIVGLGIGYGIFQLLIKIYI